MSKCERCGFNHGFQDACLIEMPLEEKLTIAVEALEHCASMAACRENTQRNIAREALAKIKGEK